MLLRLLIGFGLAALSAPADQIVIAHRGASGYLPEHTLEAYAFAYAQGADYIEPDLVLTKDKVFICLHDIHLESTTNVEEVFPDRKRADGEWYAADFTLAEVKSLQAEERLAKRFPQGAPGFQVPTFEEMIGLVQGLNASTGRNVGIYPELKAGGWHASSGLPMEEAFLALCTKHGYTGKDARIFVQSFEPQPLMKIRNELKSELPQIQLISSNILQANMISEAGLALIAKYANGIGPDLSLVEKDPALVERAHAVGLQVHPYTLRKDMLPPKYKDISEAVKTFFDTYKVDGFFTDFPDTAADYLKARSK
jgi:glycerophosphoryl diester phosphodiesterase